MPEIRPPNQPPAVNAFMTSERFGLPTVYGIPQILRRDDSSGLQLIATANKPRSTEPNPMGLIETHTISLTTLPVDSNIYIFGVPVVSLRTDYFEEGAVTHIDLVYAVPNESVTFTASYDSSGTLIASTPNETTSLDLVTHPAEAILETSNLIPMNIDFTQTFAGVMKQVSPLIVNHELVVPQSIATAWAPPTDVTYADLVNQRIKSVLTSPPQDGAREKVSARVYP